MTNMIDWVNEYADQISTEVLFIGGTEEEIERFAPAIIGIAHRFGMSPVVAYNLGKVIEIFGEDMTREEAEEHFSYNVIGSWMGEGTPIFVDSPDEKPCCNSFPQGIGIDISGQ